MLGAAVLLMLDNLGHPPDSQHHRVTSAFNDVEWVTIFFFVGLFIVVHGVEVSGLLNILAERMLEATGGDLTVTTLAILWALGDSLGDHRQYSVRRHHDPADQEHGAGIRRCRGADAAWWALSLGACLGGNGTLIGASANLTVAGIAERNGVPFRFLTFLKYAFPMMLVSIVISHVYVYLRYLS